MRSVSPAVLAGLVFIASLSPVIIFIRFGSALGSGDARLVYTGTEALINVIWIVIVALGIGAIALYAARRFNLARGADARADELRAEVDGLYRLSISDGRVSRGQQQVSLAPLQFKLLEYLTRGDGSLRTTEDILQELYGDTEDRQALNQLISRLRAELNIHDYIRRNENNLGYSFSQWTPPLSPG